MAYKALVLKKKAASTKKTAQKVAKKNRGRKPGSKNKPKIIHKEESFLPVVPKEERMKHLLGILDNLAKEEVDIISRYPVLPENRKKDALRRLDALLNETSTIRLYYNLSIQDRKGKKGE